MQGDRPKWLACFVVITASALLTAPAAQGRSGLVFARAKPLSISWGQLVAGKRLTVCNGSGKAARHLTAAAGGFGFKSVEKGRAKSKAIEIKVPPSRKIPAGTCRSMVLRASDGAKVKAGSYTGAVVVTARGSGVARIGVTVTRTKVAATPISIHGAVEEATLHLTNHAPSGAAGSQTVGNLLLAPPPGGERPLPLGEECNRPDEGEVWDDETCPLIGNLYQGTNIVHVFIAGRVDEGEGVEKLPVRISSNEHLVGDYEGQLDPALSGDKEQLVKTKLTASDSVVWAILAVILGAAIAIFLQMLTQRYRPTFLLEQRRRAIVTSYRDARTWDPKNRKINVDVHATSAYADSVREAIQGYKRSALVVDNESEAYQQIDASIVLAEKDAEALVARDGLRAALDPLEAEVEKVRTMLAGRYDIERTPAMLARASAPLTEGSLGVGDGSERAKAARELTPLLRDWRQLTRRQLEYEVWLIALSSDSKKKKKKKKKKSAWSSRDKNLLRDAAFRLAESRGELFAASKQADLDRLNGSFRIEAIVAKLSDLGGKHKIGIPTDPEPILKSASASLPVAVKKAFPELAERAPKATPEGVPWNEWEIEGKPAKAATLPEKKRPLLFIDILALASGAITAIVVALAGFYFGKTFGGLEDYLTVIFSATFAQALVKAVMDNLEVFMHDISTATNVDKPTAKIAPKTS